MTIYLFCTKRRIKSILTRIRSTYLAIITRRPIQRFNMYRNQTCYGVFHLNKKLSVIALVFTLISTITRTSGEFYCSQNGPFSDVLEAESEDGWQQWKDNYDDVFYINHKTKQMREDDPTSFFSQSRAHKKIKMSYPEESLREKIELFNNNLLEKGEKDHDCFNLTVNRSEILQDSYRKFMEGEAIDDLKRLCSVSFENETAADEKETLVEEWFRLLFGEIFDQRKGFFRPADLDNLQVEINPESKDLNYFKFIGRIVGAAVYKKMLINVDFVKPYYQIMLGEPIQIEGESADKTTREAIREKYLTSVENQLCTFLEGFAELIPLHTIRIFSVNELKLVMGGETTIDLDQWKAKTLYFNCTGKPEVAERFWNIVDRFKPDERKLLLQFATGSSRLPVGGFESLWPEFGVILEETLGIDQIPRASPDYNRIILSNYSSEEEMRNNILAAINKK